MAVWIYVCSLSGYSCTLVCHKSKTLEGEGVKWSPHPNDLVLTLNWVFENQPIVSGILIEPSNRKQFASRRKLPLGKGVICIYIYTIDLLVSMFSSILFSQSYNSNNVLIISICHNMPVSILLRYIFA